MTVAPPEKSETAQAQPTMASFRHVMKNRHFLRLWLAQFISLTIFNATNFAVVALVNDVTHSVLMSGLAIIAFTLPAVPFGAIAGAIVDQLDKRMVLWVTNILRMGMMLLMLVSLLAAPTNMWPLFGLTFVTSFISQFFIPAEGSAIPLLVGEGELMPALSLFNISVTLSQAIGYLILGRIIATIFPPFTLTLGSLTLHVKSIDMLFVIMALLYAICTILILYIPALAFNETRPNKSEHHDALSETNKAFHNLWRDMMEGWRIVNADRLLLFSVIQVSVVGVISLLIGELAGSVVQQFFHRPADDMALILAPAGIGLVGASILMPQISERVGKIRLAAIGVISLAIGFLLLPALRWLTYQLDPQHGAGSMLFLSTTMILVLLLGIALACVNVPSQTVMQERAPDSGRARILSLQYMIYSAGSIPVLLFAAVIAQFLGLNLLILLVSLSMLAFCWWGIRYLKGRQE